MERNIFLGLILTTALIVLGAACSQTPSNSNSAMNHGRMDHNSMNHNGMMDSNSMNHNTMMNSNTTMDHSNMNHSEMKSSPNAASAPYDLQFIDTMIAHHQGAVDMAKMVESRTQRAELRAFANKIIADQNKEIAQMKEWREKWYAGAPAAINMEMPGMANSMKMDMSKLSAAKDRAFDLMFIEMMIPHHSGATAMSKEALTKAQHAELKTMVQSIIMEQEAEITQMEVWKSEWSK